VTLGRLFAAGVAAALSVRVMRSRRRRSLHPAGRSFTGELEVWGLPAPVGAALIDDPGRHPATVRVSKGAGTRGDRPDVLGLAIRVDGRDLLLSTVGTGRLTRFLPAPRRGFDTLYGSIQPFRTPDGTRWHLSAVVDPDGVSFGRTLDGVASAARSDRAAFLVRADGRPFGRIRLGAALTPAADAALAFDPIRRHPDGLRPTGPLTVIRAAGYRASQRWRSAL
jgi:hypothetical protein